MRLTLTPDELLTLRRAIWVVLQAAEATDVDTEALKPIYDRLATDQAVCWHCMSRPAVNLCGACRAYLAKYQRLPSEAVLLKRNSKAIDSNRNSV